MTWLSNPKTSWISRLTSQRAICYTIPSEKGKRTPTSRREYGHDQVERQEAAGKTSDNSFPVHDAYEAIYFLDEFTYQTRGE